MNSEVEIQHAIDMLNDYGKASFHKGALCFSSAPQLFDFSEMPHLQLKCGPIEPANQSQFASNARILDQTGPFRSQNLSEMQQIYTRGLTGRKLVNNRNLLQLPQLTRDAKSIEKIRNWGLSPKKRQARKSEIRTTKQADVQRSVDLNAELTLDINHALSQCSENKVMVKTPSVVQLVPKVST